MGRRIAPETRQIDATLRTMKKILIIEDDPITGKIYHTQFEKAGYGVDLVADGQEGFYRIQEGKYDGVLLDLMLPHMGGLEILRKIRAQRSFQKLVVVVFTASFMTDMFDAANEAGANRVFHKSNLAPQDLIEVMKQELPVIRGIGTNGQPHTTDERESVDYRAELVETFLKRAPETLDALEAAYQKFVSTSGLSETRASLRELYRRLHAFSGVAGLAGMKRLGDLCNSMEVLLLALHENPTLDTPSPRRTLGRTTEFLRQRFRDLATASDITIDRPVRVLVVSNDLMSRRAASFALNLDGFEVAAHDDSRASLELLAKRAFHLVMVDEAMTGLTGSQLISRMHQAPPNEATPAILALGLPEFQARTASPHAPNLDFIARPYLFAELATKAVTLLLNHQLRDVKPLNMASDQR